jgi:hypothetical protein
MTGEAGKRRACREFDPLIDEINPACIDKRKDTVTEPARMDGRRDSGGDASLPIGKFPASDEVAGVEEGRPPCAIDVHRVPTDVVDVQMGAEDEVNRFGRNARRAQPIEPACARTLAPDREFRAILVLADAGVDEDRAPVEFQSKALDRAAQAIAGEINEVGRDRIAAPFDRHKIESWQKRAQRQRKIVVIDDDSDLNIADRKTHKAAPISALVQTVSGATGEQEFKAAERGPAKCGHAGTVIA